MNGKEKILLRAMAKNQFEIMNMFERLFSLLWETEDAALQLLNEDEHGDGGVIQDFTVQTGGVENVDTVITTAETKVSEVVEDEPMAQAKKSANVKISKICEICGKEFEAKRNQRYCSSVCVHKGKMKTQNERRAKEKAAEAKQIAVKAKKSSIAPDVIDDDYGSVTPDELDKIAKDLGI